VSEGIHALKVFTAGDELLWEDNKVFVEIEKGKK